MDAKGGNSGGNNKGNAGCVGKPGDDCGSKGSGAGGGGVMKAPGGDGAYISRDAFENNPKGYFSNLRENQKGK